MAYKRRWSVGCSSSQGRLLSVHVAWFQVSAFAAGGLAESEDTEASALGGCGYDFERNSTCAELRVKFYNAKKVTPQIFMDPHHSMLSFRGGKARIALRNDIVLDMGQRGAPVGNDSALSVFLRVLRVRSLHSTAVAQLLEATTKALEAGELQLDSICLDELRMIDEDVEEIVDALITSGLPIRNLSLANNNIGDVGAAAVARLLDDVPRGYLCVLSSLDLRGNKIGPRGCQVLTERLRKNTTLTSFDISSNTLGSKGGVYLAQMLADNATIERLVINNTDMTEGGFTAVVSVLREGKNPVRELSIGSQLLSSREDIVTYQISRLFETPACMLRSLNLTSSSIGDEGANVLRGALTGHPTIRSLDLSRNRIGITGGQALAKLLVGDSSLTSLDLRANSVGDEGAQAFKVVLLHNQSLTRLDLRSNAINDLGLEALAEGMECNSSVECLLVWGNHFGQMSLRRFGDLAGERFAFVDMFIDVHPYLVDGIFHAAEKCPS